MPVGPTELSGRSASSTFTGDQFSVRLQMVGVAECVRKSVLLLRRQQWRQSWIV